MAEDLENNLPNHLGGGGGPRGVGGWCRTPPPGDAELLSKTLVVMEGVVEEGVVMKGVVEEGVVMAGHGFPLPGGGGERNGCLAPPPDPASQPSSPHGWWGVDLQHPQFCSVL